MSGLVTLLQRSTGIVKSWGESRLSNGQSLADQLTFDGVSLWDVMAPTLALYYVPAAISGAKPSYLFGRVRPHISLAKHRTLSLVKRRRNWSGCDGDSYSGSPYVFMGFSSYMYRDVLHPVAEWLAHNTNREGLVLHDELHWRDAPRSLHSVRSESVWRHCDVATAVKVSALGRQLRAAIFELRKMEAFPSLIRAEGESLWFQMQDAFNWLFNLHLPLLASQIPIARHILKRHRAAIIISADVADPRARIFSLLGRQLRIPSLELQFGSIGSEGIEWQFSLADHVAAWGEASRDSLLEHGVLPQQVSITGSPRYDSLVNVDDDEVFKTRARLGIPAGYAMVVCASTYQTKEYNSLSEPELLLSMKRAVFKSAGELEGFCLVVKPHPLENLRETKFLIGKGRNIVLVDPSDDIRELTRACDAFLAFGSTATMYAMVANKLTICPVFPGWIWSDIFVRSNAVLVPQSEEDVLRSFRSVVNGSVDKVKAELEPARVAFLRKWVYEADGRSSERAATLAMEMVADNQRTIQTV